MEISSLISLLIAIFNHLSLKTFRMLGLKLYLTLFSLFLVIFKLIFTTLA